ncbi:hypothetical protein FA95DRAFT_442712 [Auriscalpium vulgare]|uniref:Uncharacterized protein n=1 Tax=Auriscalpium vulgare TaxID=40419 RepID=A0ACB8RG15_9AGAM|nr:hypothetical protein FA95DRAFT_442712 [Auriscalpium vulgare]
MCCVVRGPWAIGCLLFISLAFAALLTFFPMLYPFSVLLLEPNRRPFVPTTLTIIIDDRIARARASVTDSKLIICFSLVTSPLSCPLSTAGSYTLSNQPSRVFSSPSPNHPYAYFISSERLCVRGFRSVYKHLSRAVRIRLAVYHQEIVIWTSFRLGSRLKYSDDERNGVSACKVTCGELIT